jgi:hypothetical protein
MDVRCFRPRCTGHAALSDANLLRFWTLERDMFSQLASLVATDEIADDRRSARCQVRDRFTQVITR